MTTTCFRDSRFLQEAGGQSPLQLPLPQAESQREPLRHILLSSRDGVHQTIHQLHSLGYVDQSYWSQLITVPSSGIVITPHQGEVMSYLLRMRMLD
ncbi:hypothetical protein C7293_03350 [filamentous cyanobacterium CCT1]|nr:hypothetical protein C7293_03350 [filamentous cyanobacterium CCT1]PSN79922.1 hypothetical protein C8B47_09085 [filamentous cyanobacterium CCP4]